MARPVRCDTFGPVALQLWKLVGKRTGGGKRAAGAVCKMKRKNGNNLSRLNLDPERLLIANHISAEED